MLKNKLYKTSMYVLFTLASVVIIVPLLWILLLSFKDSQQFFDKPLSIPTSLYFGNYIKAFEVTNIVRSYSNSLLITISATAINLAVTLASSFALARFRFKFNNLIYTFLVMGLVVPVFSVIYPLFIITKTAGLLDTYWSVILPSVAFSIPVCTLILVGFMRAIPSELEDAVAIDGGGIMTMLLRMIIPISIPAISTAIIFNFLHNWNDFALPFILLNKDSMKTLPVVMTFFTGEYGTDYPGIAAGVVLGMVPILIFYAIFQKFVTEGMTAGAVKG